MIGAVTTPAPPRPARESRRASAAGTPRPSAPRLNRSTSTWIAPDAGERDHLGQLGKRAPARERRPSTRTAADRGSRRASRRRARCSRSRPRSRPHQPPARASRRRRRNRAPARRRGTPISARKPLWREVGGRNRQRPPPRRAPARARRRARPRATIRTELSAPSSWIAMMANAADADHDARWRRASSWGAQLLIAWYGVSAASVSGAAQAAIQVADPDQVANGRDEHVVGQAAVASDAAAVAAELAGRSARSGSPCPAGTASICRIPSARAPPRGRPRAMPVVPGPSAATVPAVSCPSVNGSG